MEKKEHTPLAGSKASLAVFLVFLAALIVIVAAVVYAGISYKVESGSPAEAAARDFGDGGTNAATGEAFDIPCSIRESDLSELTLVKRLPDDLSDADMLCIKTKYQKIRVSIDGSEVYSFGYDCETPHGPMIGYAWNMIKLDDGCAGAEVTVTLSPSGTSYLTGVYSASIGMHGNILLKIISENLVMLVFCLSLFILGVFCLAIALILRTGGFKVCTSFLYIGLFTLLATVWIVGDSQMLWLFHISRAAAYYISYGSFMLMVIPLLMFFRQILPRYSAVINTLCLVFSAVGIAQFALHFADLLYLRQTLIVTHVLMLISTFIAVYMILSEFFRTHGKALREMLIGFMSFGIISVAALVNYYVNDIGDNSLIFRLGLMVLIVLLVAGAVRNGISAINEQIASQTYRSIAYTDVLTGLANRTSFSDYMNGLRADLGRLDTVAFIMLDLNNLKNTNDTLGHAAGDRLIKDTAGLAVKAFGSGGRCFRIGGDEFVAAFENVGEEELRAHIGRFNEYVAQHNETAPVQISIALGFELRTAADAEPYDVLHVADTRMYEHKLRMKQAALASAEPKDYI